MLNNASTNSVRPIGRLLAVELSDDEIHKVAGGSCNTYTRCCTHDRAGNEDPGCKSSCDDPPSTTGTVGVGD